MFFTQEVAAVSMCVYGFGREALLKLRKSISECEAAANGRHDWLVGGDLSFSGKRVAVRKADGIVGAREVGPSK